MLPSSSSTPPPSDTGESLKWPRAGQGCGKRRGERRYRREGRGDMGPGRFQAYNGRRGQGAPVPSLAGPLPSRKLDQEAVLAKQRERDRAKSGKGRVKERGKQTRQHFLRFC